MRALTALFALLLLAGSGCSTGRSDGFSFRSEHLQGVGFDEAFQAAEEALGEHFVIAKRDRAAGVLISGPALDPHEFSTSSTSRHRRRTASRRRVAEVRVVADDTLAHILCKVVIQENKSYGVHSMNRMRGVDDQPTSTPAERDAGSTREQNDVWVSVRRDVATEHAILRTIRRLTSSPENGGLAK